MSQQRIRIAIVAATFPPSVGGGIASAHFRLGQLLANSGADVRYFAYLDPLPSTDNTIRQTSTHTWNRVVRRFCSLFFRLFDPSGRAYQTADILASWQGARKLRHDLEVFAPNEIILPDHGCPGLALGGLRTNARVSLVAHHNPMRFISQPGLNPHSILDARIAVALEKISLRYVDRIVAPCHYMETCTRETYKFKGPISVIPNLIDFATLDSIAPHDFRERIGLEASTPVIYVPSAASRFKGSVLLSELLAEIREAVGSPIGYYLSGSMSTEFRRSLPAGLAIFAPGSVPAMQNLSYVKACTLAVSPTMIENFSMALLEAQLIGLPVVTFDVGGNRELVEHGQSGSIVPLNDVHALAELAASWLDRLLKTDASSIRTSCRRRFDPALWLPMWLSEKT
ncbi:MAG: glycosyltransferase [Alphaproteobacteria bacterium]|nr:glycosyltransferase [Alphaproteobacteria bacterium]